MNNIFDEKTIPGLSEAGAAARLKKEGYNEIPSQKRKGSLFILLDVLREPMLLLLISCGLVYLLLGEFTDAMMLVSFVLVVIGITLYQERKTERALEALRNLSSPRALVIRDGRRKRIAGREVVRGDFLVLREGDRVPADAVVVSGTNLSVDESLLTGESAPVRKSEWDGEQRIGRPGGDDLPFVYSGTLVVQGRGVARVASVGMRTEMGKIGKALQEIREERTLLQRETDRIVRNFSLAGIALCLLVVVSYGLTRGNWLNGLLSGLTLSMAILPEEFPVVLMIFLTMGAWRISRSRVLTRRTRAIETLGAASVLCADKTGTLTENNMRLTAVWAQGEDYEIKRPVSRALPEAVHHLMEYGILASQRDPFDPIEREIKEAGEFYLSGTEHLHKNWTLVKEYPLSKHLLALSQVWASPDMQNYVIAAKGSPEAIADLCHLHRERHEQLVKAIEEMARRGLRVLGVARASFRKAELPDGQHDFGFEFIGLLGFIDPVRPAVLSSVREAQEAGIRVIMITGDYPGTAVQIAREIGLANPGDYLTGPDLEQMDRRRLREKIQAVNVFARVVPEQKLAIVDALKANGEIVAMTGDGVNDAPALKSAHIGIAMGERGTDVAREASALVLLNDDFSSIVYAVRLGRRIFDNLKKAITYIFAVHVPIAGMSLLPVIFNLPIVLLPAHIAFLELIIDPACSIVFESVEEEKNVMTRPPRGLREPLFNRKALWMSGAQGLSILAVVFAMFIFSLRGGKGELAARTLAFTTLVFANLMLIVTNLSWSKNIFGILKMNNQALWWVITGTVVALNLVLDVPWLRNLFHFSALPSKDVVIALLWSAALLLWFEGLKMLSRRQEA